MRERVKKREREEREGREREMRERERDKKDERDKGRSLIEKKPNQVVPAAPSEARALRLVVIV